MAVTKGRQFKRPRCCNGTGPGANPPPPPLPAWSLCAAGKNPNSGRLAAESRVPRLSPATDLGPGAALSLFSICKVDITTAPVPGVPGAWGGAPQMDTRDRQGPVCPLRPAIRAPHARPRPRSRRLRGQRASAGWARGPPHPPPPPPPGAHSPSEREVAARPPAGRKCSRAPPGRPRTLPGRSRSPEDRCLGDLGGGGRGASGAAGVGPRQAGPPHRYLHLFVISWIEPSALPWTSRCPVWNCLAHYSDIVSGSPRSSSFTFTHLSPGTAPRSE